MAKVILARRVHAVGSAAKVNAVHVQFQNFVLGIAALHLNGPPKLFQLSQNRHFLAVAIQRARDLLGQRGAAAQRAAGKNADDGAENRAGAKTGVLVKNAVFARKERVLHVLGNFD